jgi:uncharacterized delta-60 repeat protein
MVMLLSRGVLALIGAAALMLSSLTAAAPSAGAASTAGSLDSTFGKGGIALAKLGGLTNVSDAVLQSNGEIVISGNFGLARFEPSGAQDTSFGQGGVAAGNFGGSLAQKADGSFISAVATSTPTGNAFGMAHVTTSGGLDQTFGSGGTVTATVVPSQTAQGFFNGPLAVLVQPADGKIVVGGTFEKSGYRGGGVLGVLARFNANGSLDTSFAGGGSLVSSTITQIQALGLDAAGDLFVMPSFAELSSAGQVNASVTPASLVALSQGGNSTFLSSGQAASGNGISVGKRNTEVQVQRFSGSGGALSTSSPFHYTSPQSSAQDSVNVIGVDSSGRTIVGGAHFLSTSVFGLARVNADGSLDTTFGSGGAVTTTIQGNEAVEALVIQADGKIVAIGYSENNSTGQTEVALVRYLAQ